MSNREPEPPETTEGQALTAWELENSPYTLEGELEGYQRFGTGVRHARGWKRVVGLLLVLTFLGPMLFGILRLLVQLVF